MYYSNSEQRAHKELPASFQSFQKVQDALPLSDCGRLFKQSGNPCNLWPSLSE